MKIYGLALAFVNGKKGVFLPPEKVARVEYTLISKTVDRFGRWDKDSFKIEKRVYDQFNGWQDLGDLTEPFLTMSRIIKQTALKQSYIFEEAGIPESDHIPVQLVVGKDKPTSLKIGESFVGTLSEHFFGITGNGIFPPEFVTDNLKGICSDPVQIKKLQSAYAGLSVALQRCKMTLVNYQRGDNDMVLLCPIMNKAKGWTQADEHFQKTLEKLSGLNGIYPDAGIAAAINKELLQMRKTFFDAAPAVKEQMLELMEAYAYEYARSYTLSRFATYMGNQEEDLLNGKQPHDSVLAARFFQISYGRSTHLKYPELEENYPVLYFIDWHPRIKKAFEDGLRHHSGCNMDFTMISPAAEPQPMLVSLVNQEMNDALRVYMGHSRADEVKNDAVKWRTRISDITKEVSCSLS